MRIAGLPPKGRLAFLEQKYKIQRKPLLAKLAESIEAQENQDLDDYAEAINAIEWKDLTRKLHYRRAKVFKAVRTLSAELTESAFDDDIQKCLDDRLAYLAGC